MAKEYARSFYKSKLWQDCRKSYIDKRRLVDGGVCEHCKRRLGYIVDHIEEITPGNINDAWITLSHDNLQYLCLECHNTKTFSKARTVAFDDDGNPIM